MRVNKSGTRRSEKPAMKVQIRRSARSFPLPKHNRRLKNGKQHPFSFCVSLLFSWSSFAPFCGDCTGGDAFDAPIPAVMLSCFMSSSFGSARMAKLRLELFIAFVTGVETSFESRVEEVGVGAVGGVVVAAALVEYGHSGLCKCTFGTTNPGVATPATRSKVKMTAKNPP